MKFFVKRWQVLVPDVWLRDDLRFVSGKAFRLHPLRKRLRLLHNEGHGSRRAGVHAARDAGLPGGIIQKVRAEIALLRNLLLLVPPDRAVGAEVRDVFSLAALEVEDHDTVLADAHEIAPLGAWRVFALQTGLWQEGRVDTVVLPALMPEDIHPALAVPRHRRLVRGPVVLGVFILAGHEAVVAVVALGHVDDHVFLFHRPTFRSTSRPAPGNALWSCRWRTSTACVTASEG